MSKMDETELLELLRSKEQSASHYIHGQLGWEREQAMREYYRQPYGNEEDGWSQIVASDVSDSVEWILPALLKTFTATDKAVSFEPNTEKDVAGAEQATDACNYVFYKQNNGFLILYTALKDMLTIKNCAVMWRKEDAETVSSVPFKGASQEMLAMMLQESEDSEIESATPAPMIGPDGQPQLDEMGQPVTVYNGRMKKTEKRSIVKVEAFSPEDLLVDREWTSPLLAECPYVARLVRVTLTDLKLMGYDCDVDDLRASSHGDLVNRLTRVNKLEDTQTADFGDTSSETNDDDSMVSGWLRMEYVLADFDGDGIAERLCVYRLEEKILKREVVSHVPIATSSPILNPHRWDGMSIADAVSDLQKLHTELLRQTLNNLYLTNNPRTKVLTDANWSPLANIDDLLDSRPGGVIRQRDMNAVTEHVTPFAAGASMPMLEYVQSMRENRTGVSRTSQGLNPDSMNNTATGRAMDMSAAMQRVELIARIIAETLVKPIFQGILKVLTDGDMQKMAFRLREEFVEYDPNEWRDQYDMTINVGLGTGDVQQKAAQLMMIAQLQEKGLALGLTTPGHMYHTGAKIIENAGFKDVQNFLQDPSKQPPQPKQPPIEIQIAQMKMQADGQKQQAESQNDIQKFQAETQMTREIEQIKADAKLREIQGNLELQAANDQRDSEREQNKLAMDSQIEQQRLEFEKWKAELDARVKLRIAAIGTEQSGDELMNELGEMEVMEKPNPIDQLAQMHSDMMGVMQQFAQNMNVPKRIVRGPDGRAVGIEQVSNAE
ncbi:hypothetical protein UFOVP1470_3 [uncultured Caudovirales phage]|uniref:Uncharacterized protein n=3 Tax=uncultured Caudovirales phage TaxID=2100421 RepID=A0A6J5RWE8_9CAUD|nr:hypothetical protein UFOVP939_22 [uncultured Caudovirales phage]CAB4183741.1 hypothetical protein UFOVP1105_2 [uncultured Caudovirales phage]CAB4202903.1 hypothetical protein UFOVP1372_46 [uncultured Caudovirales phage]CAB4214948.1 hypothetical protein UFOVP1470_3 [uncultured Caudovirales phage]CAB5230249.1 hypothetical protein UFOVP1557_46 [uncultured Caudovirales phage]